MKRIFLGASIAVLALFLLSSAVAFSVSLSSLHINAASFVLPVAAPLASAPMTYSDESNIGQPQANSVRFEAVSKSGHVCQRDKASESSDGF
jgi:hypothetical protein